MEIVELERRTVGKPRGDVVKNSVSVSDVDFFVPGHTVVAEGQKHERRREGEQRYRPPNVSHLRLVYSRLEHYRRFTTEARRGRRGDFGAEDLRTS